MPTRIPAVVVLLLATCAAAASAQSAPAPRVVSVLGGVGNTMGWLGLQGERYLANERVSLVVGAGYTPAIDAGDASGLTFAAGVRGFTPGARHRGFVELAVSQIAVETGPGGDRLYGPGAQLGYQYTAGDGFTLLVSAGLGYAAGLDEASPSSRWQPLLGLGVGYTWRR